MFKICIMNSFLFLSQSSQSVGRQNHSRQFGRTKMSGREIAKQYRKERNAQAKAKQKETSTLLPVSAISQVKVPSSAPKTFRKTNSNEKVVHRKRPEEKQDEHGRKRRSKSHHKKGESSAKISETKQKRIKPDLKKVRCFRFSKQNIMKEYFRLGHVKNEKMF